MSLTTEGGDFLKYTMKDILERLRSLEQAQRRNAENFTLSKEYNEMTTRLANLEKDNVQLKKRLANLERENAQLKKVNDEKQGLLEGAVSQMQKELRAQSLPQEEIAQLDKTRMVLNKALVRSHVNGRVQTLADNVKTLSNWKEVKRRSDNERFKSLEDAIGALDLKASGLQESSRDSIDSIICARLDKQSFESSPSTKLKKYFSKLFAIGNGLSFDTTMGFLTSRDDGVYQLGWRMVHKDTGKIRYSMKIEGMKESIYLGCTRASGDVCTGSVLLPLKADQKMWLEANWASEHAATIETGTLTAYQLTKYPVGDLEDVVTMQREMFSMGIFDCQYL